VGLRHYAPRARLVLLEASTSELEPAAAELASRMIQVANDFSGERVGVMLPGGFPVAEELSALTIFNWGRWDAPEEMAQLLYAGLRALDEQGCTVILCPVPPHEGIGVAIRDRLKKAGTKEQGLRD